MKKTNFVQQIFIIAVCVIACVSCNQDEGFSLFADNSFFVRQGSGQCGPTSFYMIFKYYGDNNFKGQFTELGSTENLLLQENLTEVTKESAVSRWLGVTDSGINIKDLLNKISDLSGDGINPYYTTEADTEITDADRQSRFAKIYNNYLKNDLPVIIHMRRPKILNIPLSGHYMVLVGYDSEKKLVYYVDPNKNEGVPAGQCVKIREFLNSGWYSSPDNSLVPDAYWDGTWIGFKHSK